MFTSGSKPHRTSSGSYVRPVGHARSTGSIPTFGSFSSTSKSSSRSRGSFLPSFGFNSSSSSSFYKRRPRDGYIQALLAKIRRILRDLYRYFRRNPAKVLVPIVMALLSSGVLAGLLGKFGMKLPKTLMSAVGAGQSFKGGYDAWYGSQHPDDHWAGSSGGAGNLFKGAVKVASAFM